MADENCVWLAISGLNDIDNMRAEVIEVLDRSIKALENLEDIATIHAKELDKLTARINELERKNN